MNILRFPRRTWKNCLIQDQRLVRIIRPGKTSIPMAQYSDGKPPDCPALNTAFPVSKRFRSSQARSEVQRIRSQVFQRPFNHGGPSCRTFCMVRYCDARLLETGDVRQRGGKKGVKRVSQVWLVLYTSLCECLLGYPHYLRWTEEMCLAKYSHFARYIDCIFMGDCGRDPLVVRGANLDETEVKRLMIQITSNVQGVTPSLRLRLLPHMMIGSRMPRMINIAPYIFPTKAQLAMTGLTSVYLRGFPVYIAHDTPRRDMPSVELCVPKRLADNAFIENMMLLQGTRWKMEDFKPTKGEPDLLTFPNLKA